MNPWVRPLSIALVAQVVTAAADMAVPVLGPVITAEAGVPATYVGYYASAFSAGAVVFYLFGASIVHRTGPVRVLQLGIAICAMSLLLVLTGSWWPILGAGLLIGLGFGTNAPASAVLLHTAVPPERMSLAFSVKQAGAPAGAILAALCLPVLAEIWSWQVSILIASGVCLAVALFIHPLKRVSATPPRSERDDGAGKLADMRAFAELARQASIRRLLVAGALLAIVQGSLGAFLVTYLVTALGHSLVVAGTLYSLFQLADIVGRIALGWLADRALSRVHALSVIGVASAVTVSLLTQLSPDTPLQTVVLCVVAIGLVVGSWNGILIAEVTSTVPADRVPEANNLIALGAFAGFVVGPTLFSQTVLASGGYETAFVVLAVSAGLSAVVLLWRGPVRCGTLD